MKIRKLVEATPALREIANQRLPMKTLYRVTRLIREIQPHLDFYDEQYQKLIMEYCTEDEGGFLLPVGSKTDFENALNELFDLDVEVNIEPVSIPENEAENLRLSYNDICALEGFIEITFKEE